MYQSRAETDATICGFVSVFVQKMFVKKSCRPLLSKVGRRLKSGNMLTVLTNVSSTKVLW